MKSFNTSLERHIFHLLFQEDRVDIPGLGRFDADKYGAKIQLESGLFLPPARRLSFSPVAGKSETLVNHLMRFEGMDDHAVDVMLGYQVQQWQQALSSTKCHGIGSGDLLARHAVDIEGIVQVFPQSLATMLAVENNMAKKAGSKRVEVHDPCMCKLRPITICT